MPTFRELLSVFKEDEGDYAENIMLVIDDANLRNGVLAWQSMIVSYDQDMVCKETHPKEQWAWLWQNTAFDPKKFAVISNIKGYEASALIERMKALRLIYPDGTSNSIARAYLREIVRSKIPVPKKPKKEKNEPAQQPS